MTSTESKDELDYHLQELRADLGLILADLEAMASAGEALPMAQAWVGAEALLEHDLEVHFPRALELLGAPQPSDVGSPELRTGAQRQSPLHGSDVGDLAATARDAGRLVAAALATLSDADPDRPTNAVSAAAQAGAAAHRILAGVQDLVSRIFEAL
ncbi:MAG TPA: hypothetical protein VNO30_13465 [Kofleriaceae bacterium]|nr:hypothetical protein [Kofleriaceae bacterium]